MELMRKPANAFSQGSQILLQPVALRARTGLFFRNVRLQIARGNAQSGDLLAEIVMQLPREASPFFFLGVNEAALKPWISFSARVRSSNSSASAALVVRSCSSACLRSVTSSRDPAYGGQLIFRSGLSRIALARIIPPGRRDQRCGAEGQRRDQNAALPGRKTCFAVFAHGPYSATSFNRIAYWIKASTPRTCMISYLWDSAVRGEMCRMRGDSPDACPRASNRIAIRSLASSEVTYPLPSATSAIARMSLFGGRYFEDVAGCAGEGHPQPGGRDGWARHDAQ